MKQYTSELRRILEHGWEKQAAVERQQKIMTKELFGSFMQFDLQQGFPLVTVKYTWFKGIIHELLWFLRGEDHIKFLQENRCHFWDKWADENGHVGPIYGYQWRNWGGKQIDQIQILVDNLKKNPCSRRHVISCWNVEQLSEMSLPPCHFAAVFNVTDNKLSCGAHQRSADFFLGVPFDIASYAALTHMLAHVCGYEVGILNYFIDSAHIYEPHIALSHKIIDYDPLPLPTLKLDESVKNIDDFEYKHFHLENYQHHGKLTAEVYA